MGFFSWECAVSNKQIMNRHSDNGATPCVLVCPDDSIIEEDNYDGYGIFGGRDAYALLAEFNDPTLEDDPVMPKVEQDEMTRGQGIDLFYSDKPAEYPLKFVAKEFYTGQKYDELPASSDAEGQGFWEVKEKRKIVDFLSGGQ